MLTCYEGAEPQQEGRQPACKLAPLSADQHRHRPEMTSRYLPRPKVESYPCCHERMIFTLPNKAVPKIISFPPLLISLFPFLSSILNSLDTIIYQLHHSARTNQHHGVQGYCYRQEHFRFDQRQRGQGLFRLLVRRSRRRQNLSKLLTHYSGKVTDIKINTEGETKTAEVTFEKETAMKTALLLTNTQLGPNHITIASASGSAPGDDVAHDGKERDSDEITQEEKPRARILAEYLAHGYVVGDAAIEHAITLDTQHNVSTRFLGTIQNLDAKYHATDRARATDQSYGITQKANNFLTGLGSYFEKASTTPTGRKIANFYTASSRQVQDIHAEARRLADLKKEEHGGSAYKAAGLERVFGQQKPKEETGAAGTADATPAATTGAAAPVPADTKTG